jgi:hypothetical protein
LGHWGHWIPSLNIRCLVFFDPFPPWGSMRPNEFDRSFRCSEGSLDGALLFTLQVLARGQVSFLGIAFLCREFFGQLWQEGLVKLGGWSSGPELSQPLASEMWSSLHTSSASLCFRRAFSCRSSHKGWTKVVILSWKSGWFVGRWSCGCARQNWVWLLRCFNRTESHLSLWAKECLRRKNASSCHGPGHGWNTVPEIQQDGEMCSLLLRPFEQFNAEVSKRFS